MSKAQRYNEGRISPLDQERLVRYFQDDWDIHSEDSALVVDGMFGPETKAALDAYYGPEEIVITGKEWGEAALARLRSVLGQGEEGGNNRGPFIERIGGVQGRAWCARLISWVLYIGWADLCFNRFGASLAYPCPVQSTGGARDLCRQVVELGGEEKASGLARAGDLVLWSRGNPNNPEDAWKGHVGMVSQGYISPTGYYPRAAMYVAGNEGDYPAVVKESQIHEYHLEGFYRLPDISLDTSKQNG